MAAVRFTLANPFTFLWAFQRTLIWDV